MKFILLILGPLALACSAVAAFLYWYGRRLSKTHRESSFLVVQATPQQIWDRLADYRSLPQYGQQVDTVVEESVPPTRLVRRLSDAGLPFGGTWTFDIEPICQGTKVTITEDGFIRSPIFRAIAHLFIGMKKSQETVLKEISA